MTKSKLFFGDWPATVSRSSRNSAEGQLDFASKESPGVGGKGKFTTFNSLFLKNWLMIGLMVFGLFTSFHSSATTCPNATVIPAAIAMPYTASLTCGTANDITGTNAVACGNNSYLGGLESVFTWTPSADYIGASIAYAGVTWTGIRLYQGCPTSGGICIANVSNSATSKSLTGLSFTTGVTYFIVIDTWPSPASPCPGTITLNGTVNAACTGTPAPGNTISSTAGGCLATAFNLTLQNATIGSGVTYLWESASDAGFTTNVQTLSSTTPTQTITNQTVSTYYRCSVTCSGNTGISTPVFVPQNAPTACYCIPTLQTATFGCTDGDVIAQVSINQGATNLYTNTSGTGCPGGTTGYSDYTGLGSVVTLQAGNTYACQVFAGQYSEHYTAWVDYNDDGVFDASERIGYTTSQALGSGSIGVLGGSASFPITLACNPPTGVHRMRVRCAFGVTNGLTITPCALAASNYGETEDYLITIAPALACPAPSALVASSPTESTVNLAWTAGCVETAWNIEYGPTGFTPGTGTVVAAATNPFVATGLACNSAFDFYVYANCGGAGASLPSLVASATTTICPCSGTPSPGATLSSAGAVCVNEPFTLSLQNPSTDAGLTYVWESADDAGFTTNVQTLTSTTGTQAIASQTVASYYRCTVTCGPSGLSTVATAVFVGQNTGVSCYCIPAYTSGIASGDLISNVEITGTSLANNSGTATSPNISYTFYGPPTYAAANYTATLVAGNTYNVVVTIGSFANQGLKAWIDYNDNGAFEATEAIGNTTSAIGTAFGTGTFPITIACNPPTGTHRMRIREVFANAGPTIDPCASYGWGETEDYLITIAPPLPCPAPSALVASNPTATTVDLNWTIGCSETAWDVEYGPTGFTPGTGTSVAVTSNPATISGLVCGTAYDFYVYADCGGAGGSLPSLVASATTGICPCTGTPTPGNTIVAGTACTAGSTVNLSLQNATTGSSVTYQWQSADDAAFTTNVVNLGTGATQVGTVNGPTYFRCQVTCATGPASAFSTPVLVDISTVGTGNTLADPIIIGAAPCSATPYTNTVNNGACFTDNLVGSEASPDVFYQFTLAAPATVQAGLCGSGFDTYIHLLDNTGAILQSNDDNGPLCAGTTSSLSAALAAGTYYIVTEGYGSNLGNLSLTLNTTDPCSASMNITAFVEGYYLSGSSPAAMAAASYDNLVNSGSATPGNATDVCLVTVELWPDALGSTYSATGMLNTDGSLSVTFPAAALGGTYWIALTSPNTLRTFSASSITLASTNTYNFSSSLASAATDGSSDPLATLTAGLFGLRSGDINQDEFIDGTDYAVFEGDVINSANGAFSLPSDLNGDSFVDGTDYPILDVNSASGFYSQYPAFL